MALMDAIFGYRVEDVVLLVLFVPEVLPVFIVELVLDVPEVP